MVLINLYFLFYLKLLELNYKNKELIFKDGDYILNENQLKDKGVINRNDWYYII